ncbi:hypothetical protein EV200_101375 [Pedobacter psychrotolerans]|uniref:Uncharacterized protein n=1 Tax=Pedobacter psychrotolerans TaxID=1843235 RepID=A0A4R2HNV3_9SPHI|nr:hypothetical protein [Pedobacter psychrotolerans]TCO30934.1 hypothetical protein EV200_101375 [Pedobacter psychrotolerans]GGE43453.1 hypothetical protein GCM10011413_06770 [Pedobacter psychrotolerans]
MSKLKVAESLIDEVAAVYLDEIIRIVERRLKSAPKDVMRSDLGLLNVWEEFCYQLQTERFDSFNILENYIYQEISKILDDQHEYRLKVLSYQFLGNGANVPIYMEGLSELIYEHLLKNGTDYFNKRLEKVIY